MNHCIEAVKQKARENFMVYEPKSESRHTICYGSIWKFGDFTFMPGNEAQDDWLETGLKCCSWEPIALQVSSFTICMVKNVSVNNITNLLRFGTLFVILVVATVHHQTFDLTGQFRVISNSFSRSSLHCFAISNICFHSILVDEFDPSAMHNAR